MASISIAPRYGACGFGVLGARIADGYRLDSQSIFSQLAGRCSLPAHADRSQGMVFPREEPVNHSLRSAHPARSHPLFDRLPQSSGGRVELVLERRHVPARYPTDHRHFRLTHRRHDARRDDGTVDPPDRTSDRRSSIPQPLCGTPRSAEHAACLTWHIVIRSIGKELPG